MNNNVNTARKWEADYARKTDGWDLGGPTPVFEYLLSGQALAPGRMIVLGAGRGHDARLFARHGFQVTAVASGIAVGSGMAVGTAVAAGPQAAEWEDQAAIPH